jgi:hypothetical protein
VNYFKNINSLLVYYLNFPFPLLCRKFVKNYFQKNNKFILINYLKSNDFLNTKLFNRTRIRLVEALSAEILSQCEKELTMIFQEYLVSNIFLEKDADIYLKAFDSTEEKNSKK